MITTKITINSVINNIVGVILFNRIGTNALEHHFGLILIICHYQHNFEKFAKSEQKVKILNEIEQITIGNVISQRKEAFSEIAVLDDNCPMGKQSMFLMNILHCRNFGNSAFNKNKKSRQLL